MALPQTDTRDVRDDLFDERFLKKLEYLHVVARKVFSGNLRAERQLAGMRVRRLWKKCVLQMLLKMLLKPPLRKRVLTILLKMP